MACWRGRAVGRICEEFFAKNRPLVGRKFLRSRIHSLHAFPGSFHHPRTDKPKRAKHSARAFLHFDSTSKRGNPCGGSHARRRANRTTAEQLALTETIATQRLPFRRGREFPRVLQSK